MRVLVCVLLVFAAQFSFAQAKRVSFAEIDWKAASVEAATPEVLAHELTAAYTTDLEKVRSIFRWITEHIAYGVKRYPVAKSFGSLQTKTDAYMDSVINTKSLNEIIAYDVLKKRTAICNGYTRLFKTLCDYAGVKCEIITGYARTNMGSRKFRSNHTWNAVMLDSAWHLLDVTWASGYINFGDEFVKQYNDYYFLTPPNQLINSHYPEDLQWSLLFNPPTIREYHNMPFRHSAFVKYKINSFKPSNGIIEASLGDTVLLELEVSDAAKDWKIAPEGYYDSAMLATTPASWAFLKPVIEGNGKKVVYAYPVATDTVEWLHVVYNDDVILRYKLNVRKSDTAIR